MTTSVDRGSRARTSLGVAGVLLTPFVAVTDGLVVAISLPTISRDIELGTVAAAWVVNTTPSSSPPAWCWVGGWST